MIVLYALFTISLFCPIYTYALYPVILRMFKGKNYKNENIEPAVSVVVVGEDAVKKIENVQYCTYPEIEVYSGGYGDANKAKGEIIIFTDTKTKMDQSAIREIVKPFVDRRVGAVVGQQTNPKGNSAFWKYENLVKQLESRIGCVSGANESLFAVRKSELPEVPDEVLNKPFYLVTKITENGNDVVFTESAKAYEGKNEGTNFEKHVKDAAGYWQAFKMFPKLLFGGPGSFVYVSHRVMKWFVWLNMLMILLISIVLAKSIKFMVVILAIQLFTYITVIIFGRIKRDGFIGKLINIGYYFLSLNFAYFVGMFQR